MEMKSSAIQKLLQPIFNTTLYKTVAICGMMLSPTFPFFIFDELVSIFLLVWGAVILFKDLLTERTFMKAPYSIFLLALVVSYAVTVLCFAKNELLVTINWYGWMFIQFFLLYAFCEHKTLRGIVEEIVSVNKPVMTVSLVLSVAGLVMYLARICVCIPATTEGGALTVFGLVRDRNYGLFNNPIPFACSAYLGMTGALFNLTYRRFTDSLKKSAAVFYIATAAVCFLALNTTFTRTYIFIAYFTVAATMFSYCFLFNRGDRSMAKRLGSGALCLVVSMALLLGTYKVQQVAFPAIAGLSTPKVYMRNADDSSFSLNEEIKDELVKESVEMKRTEFGNTDSFLGPRYNLWNVAFDMIPHSPIFGFTSGNRMEYSVMYDESGFIESKYPNGLHTFDNAYIDITVSAGFVGLVLILLFILMNAIQTLRVVFFRKTPFADKAEALGYAGIAVYVIAHVFIACNFFNLLIFAGNSTCIYFWMILGALARANELLLEKECPALKIATPFDRIFKRHKNEQ